MNRQILLGVIVGSALLTAACKSGDATNGDSEPLDSMTDSSASSDTDTDTDSMDAESDTNGPLDTDSETEGAVTVYEGFEELYIMTDGDDPTDVCRVRYEIRAVGEPSVPCAQCEWDVVVEKSNPTVIVDVDGACANSDLGLDEDTIASSVGERFAYGFVSEYVGHANVLMSYNEESGQWEALTTANWNEETSAFRYNRRDGYCFYSSAGDTEASSSGICGLSGEATVSD